MKKIYQVSLIPSEFNLLNKLIKKGATSARIIRRANILLLANQRKGDLDIATVLHCGGATVQRIRQRYVTEGLESALYDKSRPGQKKSLDTKQEAELVAIACSDPPEGSAKWTLDLLVERLEEDKIVKKISRETVRLYLKKTGLSLGNKKCGAYQR